MMGHKHPVHCKSDKRGLESAQHLAIMSTVCWDFSKALGGQRLAAHFPRLEFPTTKLSLTHFCTKHHGGLKTFLFSLLSLSLSLQCAPFPLLSSHIAYN